jgi:predicted TIM-barrel fold metal-dependent hydrolase
MSAIDVHHHLIPTVYRNTLDRLGIDKVAGASLPVWSPERSLRLMDQHDINLALTSLSAPGVWFGDDAAACSLARACNEYAAGMAAEFPGRFGSFAVLPMPLVQESCAEAVHALDVLGAAGVVLLASTHGTFLGDPSLDDLMRELNQRSAVVFVHPNIHATSTTLGLNMPGFFVEFLCDTTRAVANLLFTGTLHRYPDIRWVLSHAGGFVPFIAWRLALADGIPELAANMPGGVLQYLRSLYYDTALSPSPFALAALRELVTPDHILFGSDFPFAPAAVVAKECTSLEGTGLFDASAVSTIRRGSAELLFPQLSGVQG